MSARRRVTGGPFGTSLHAAIARATQVCHLCAESTRDGGSALNNKKGLPAVRQAHDGRTPVGVGAVPPPFPVGRRVRLPARPPCSSFWRLLPGNRQARIEGSRPTLPPLLHPHHRRAERPTRGDDNDGVRPCDDDHLHRSADHCPADQHDSRKLDSRQRRRLDRAFDHRRRHQRRPPGATCPG